MKSLSIDNTDGKVLDRSITWQYEGAEHLVRTILMLKKFFAESTTDYYDELMSRLDLADENIADFGLSIWGKILNVPRLIIEIAGIRQMISSAFYRRILLSRIRLLRKDATIPNYIAYVKELFGNDVKITDGKDMSMSFSINIGNTLTDEELAAIDQCSDSLFIYPAGVKDNIHSDSLMFGLSDTTSTAQDTFCGGLDESSYCWRYTPKGNWR